MNKLFNVDSRLLITSIFSIASLIIVLNIMAYLTRYIYGIIYYSLLILLFCLVLVLLSNSSLIDTGKLNPSLNKISQSTIRVIEGVKKTCMMGIGLIKSTNIKQLIEGKTENR